jgi:sporulation protein YlmC with PRC-barrel domain
MKAWWRSSLKLFWGTMLLRLKKLQGLPIDASDGEIGTIKDVYFDDRQWAARYVAVETGSRLGSRNVLISTMSVQSIDWMRNRVQVGLTRKQIAASPPMDTHKPVSRQHERQLFDHYGYPYYWAGPFLWGAGSHPFIPAPPLPPSANLHGKDDEAPGDPHLRRAQEVRGYRIETTDDSVGQIEDFLVDSENWEIRYLVVDTRNWLPGRRVVIPPKWITGVDWMQRVVNVDVSPRIVQASPEYQPAQDFSRTHEANLYRHYGRPGYWQ